MTDQKIITVIARRWWDGSNTYHSCEVYVNGELLERVPFTYGYDSAWTQTALEILYKHNVYKKSNNNRALWNIVKEDHNDKLIQSVTDVQRKKHL